MRHWAAHVQHYHDVRLQICLPTSCGDAANTVVGLVATLVAKAAAAVCTSSVCVPVKVTYPVRVQHVSAGCDSCEDERACQSRRLGADKGVSAWAKGLPRRQRAPQCAAPHGRHYITRLVVDPPCHKSTPLSLVNPSVGRRDCRPQRTSRHRTVTVTDR